MAGIERALRIAETAHAGDTEKAGDAFVTHPRRVADAVDGGDAKIVALLHDVVEKNAEWPLSRLRDEGFSNAILEAVDALTRRAGEDYFVFARRALANPLARPVKIADLRDNLERGRIGGYDEERLEKYRKALRLAGEATN
ncbi:MAG TPA: GTP pyrophosphokinase [Aurantimonas sp.]|uniref:GTP pyrophosphokinase n=1 Tax=Aurantimonas marianensis TaxID=2920428 RepID=A0A9X2H783_9HYPH|nr:GTP pyrophosphokinase [Aurantimonas marianensis]MCP3055048.1 GTP pyrophosphokinase [Aurantimonas marianensis]